MTEDPKTVDVLIAPAGAECFAVPHHLNHSLPDHVVCDSCSEVGVIAATDGIDPDTAIREFRAWSLEHQHSEGEAG